MPLVRQQVDLPILGGLEEGTDPKYVIALNEMKNCWYRRSKGISKRYGTTAEISYLSNDSCPNGLYGGAAAPPSPDGMFTYGNEIIRTGRNKLHGWSPNFPGGNSWVLKDVISPCTAIVNPVSGSVLNGITSFDSTYVSGKGLFVVAYTDSSATTTNVTIKVLDGTTGEVVSRNAVGNAQTAKNPKIITYTSSGTTYVAVFVMLSSDMWVYVYNTSTGAWANGVDIAPNIGSTSFDVVGYSSKLFILLTKGTSDVVIRSYTYSGAVITFSAESAVLQNPGNFTVSAGMDVDTGTGNLMPAWGYLAGGNGVVKTAVVVASTLVINVAATTVDSTAGSVAPTSVGVVSDPSNSNTALIAWADGNLSGGSADLQVGMKWNIVTSAVGGTSFFAHYVTPVSRPFVQTVSATARFYIAAVYRGSTAPADVNSYTRPGSLYIADLCKNDSIAVKQKPRVVATIRPRQLFETGFSRVVSPVADSSGVFHLVTPSNSVKATNSASYIDVAVDWTQLNFSPKRKGVEANGLLSISGGVPCSYDGVLANEYAFHYFPDTSRISLAAAAGGSLTASGVYGYRVVYETRDANGLIIQSAASSAVTITLSGGNQTVNITVPTLTITQRDPNISNGGSVQIVVYRTVAGGSSYYRVPISVANDPTVGSLTITDAKADSAINTGDQLYASLGVLQHLSPPSAGIVHTHNGRIWLADTDDGRIWYSGLLSVSEQPWFSDGLAIDPFPGGRVTGLATLDDKLIVFKANTIWVITGDGPDNLGNGSTLSKPVLLASDCGCTDPRSVILTPNGIMFLGPKSMMLLDRGLQVQYIGAGAFNTVQSGIAVTGAVILHDRGLILFGTTTASGSSTGDSLVYDMYEKTWSRWTYTCTVESAQRAAAYPVWVNSAFYFLTPSGQLYAENQATWMDGGSSWVAMTLETADFKMNTLRGFQRIWLGSLLGYKFTNHAFTLYLFTNYGTSAAQTLTHTNADFAASSNLEPEFNPVPQRCEAIRLRYVDSSDGGGTGRGSEISAVHFEFGIYPTGFRGLAPASRT
jgi:hypothetical protein